MSDGVKKDTKKNGKQNTLMKDIKIIFKALKNYCRLDKVMLPVLVSGSLLAAVQPYIMIFLTGLLLNALYERKGISAILTIAIAGLGIKLVLSLASHYLGKIMWTKLRNQHSYQGLMLGDKLMSMDYEYVENEEIQNLVRRQVEYSQTFRSVYDNLFFRLDTVIRTGISILISVSVVVPLFFRTGSSSSVVGRVINSPLFGLGVLALIGIGMYVSIRTMERTQAVTVEHQKNLIDLNRKFFYYSNNFLSGYEKGKDVRLFNMKDLIAEESEKMLQNANRFGQTMKKVKWRAELVNQPISTLTGGLVYLFLGMRAIAGVISIGNVVSYAGSILQFIDSFSGFLTSLSALRFNNQYLEELNGFLELDPVKNPGSLPVEKRSDGKYIIEFRHVYFKYPGSKDYVIEDLNMTLDIGRRMAVVGRNGSGKTTFVKLLCRLYEPTKGEILLNGVDIRQYDYYEYLKLFSVVFQDSKIFSLSIANNIAASEEADEERVMDALERVGLSDFISKMPQGINTYVYKNFDRDGVEISGGEAQKLQIARAVYHDRPFVVMDEPTAALDPLAEYEVYAGFDKMVGNKTAIYISHRLSSCRFCDDIIVFDNGRVIQRGNHAALVGQDGLYARMWNAQAQYYANTKSAVVFQG